MPSTFPVKATQIIQTAASTRAASLHDEGSDPHESHASLDPTVEADRADDDVWEGWGGQPQRPEEAGG